MLFQVLSDDYEFGPKTLRWVSKTVYFTLFSLFVYFYFRQCRNYVANEMIRLKAEFLYSKFKGLFLVGDDADFYNQVRIHGNTELKIDIKGSLLHGSTDLVQHVKPAA